MPALSVLNNDHQWSSASYNPNSQDINMSDGGSTSSNPPSFKPPSFKPPSFSSGSDVRLVPQTPYLSSLASSKKFSSQPDDKNAQDMEDCAKAFAARRLKFTSKNKSKDLSSDNKESSEVKDIVSENVPNCTETANQQQKSTDSSEFPKKSTESINNNLNHKKSTDSVLCKPSTKSTDSSSEPPNKSTDSTSNGNARKSVSLHKEVSKCSSSTTSTASPKRHMKRLSLPPRVSSSTPFTVSYSGVSESAGAWGTLGHYNILNVTTRDSNQHWFTRFSCYLVHCSRLKVNFPYPTISNEAIINDDRVQAALEQTVSELLQEAGDPSKAHSITQGQHKRAHTILNNMKAAISTGLIRLTGYVLFKVFSRFLTSVVVHKGQLEAVQKASKTGTPLIFMPLHRSHMDYLFVTWVLFNCQIPAPIVAAGDNLNMPVFGALLRGTGGFYIKRRLESNKARRDVLYRALLQCYMSQALHAGYNLEFFIEGGRTRTGKPAMPKGGLLSVILDAYLNGLLDDAMIVPIGINYDRIVDGHFVREQLGQKKVPESFWGAVCAICKVLSTNYGQSRIDFGMPFSLKEFVRSSREASPTPLSEDSAPKGHSRSYSSPITSNQLTVRRSPPPESLDSSPDSIRPAMSSSSLFGTELTDEFRTMVKNLGRHIVFDAERCQAMMSTNLVAWIVSYSHREEGVTLTTLTEEVSQLTEQLKQRNRDVGFTGSAEVAVKHAIHLLGPGLIETTDNGSGDVTYRAVTKLPDVIELNYYANSLLPVFALDAIVATCLLSTVEVDLHPYIDCETQFTVKLDKLMKDSARVCDLLCHEFVLAAPCSKVSDKLIDSVDRLQNNGLLVEVNSRTKSRQNNYSSWMQESSDEDESTVTYLTEYKLCPGKESLKYLCAFRNMLCPILDAYCATVENLQSLVGNVVILEEELVKATQKLVSDNLEAGIYSYSESIAADPIKNCLKMLEGEKVVEVVLKDGCRYISLSKSYDNPSALQKFLSSIHSVRN